MQPNIYGDIFDVINSADAAINVAYTSDALGPHMDLCYYESPPGIQLLHCLNFDDDVEGGESFVIDGFGVAETLRRTSPAAFETLATVPATFVKDHSKRAHPVLLSYRRPHISLDPQTRAIVGVFWSPPFEGPLDTTTLPPHAVGEYYAAYKVFAEAIEAAPRYEARLATGEMLVFNNRRMLHGRRAFTSRTGGRRHLRGGYVNIDEFANRYNLLRRAFSEGSEAARSVRLGNQDRSARTTVLPLVDDAMAQRVSRNRSSFLDAGGQRGGVAAAAPLENMTTKQRNGSAAA